MNSRMQDYRMLWRAAVTHANPRLSGIVRWGLAFIMVVFVAVQTAIDGPRAGLATLWCAASGFLLLNWAWRFMPGAVKLATPANAWLVPQMRRRLVELSCLVCFVGVAGIASAPYTDAGNLGPGLFWVVLFIMGVGLAAAGHPAGSPVVTALCCTGALAEWLPETLSATLSHPVVVVLSLPVYAAVIVVAVRAMFPQGGERHWAMMARRLRWVAATGKPDPLVGQMAGKGTMSAYGAILRRDSERRDGRRLVLHALGPTHHLAETVAVLAVLAAVVFFLGILTGWRGDREAHAGIGWLFACMLLVVPLMHSVRLGQLAPGLATEQGLVRLAPAMPASPAAFNVRLGRSLLLQALTAWGMAAGAALLLAALGGAGPEALLRVASLACMVLPVVAVPLRDHASRTQSAVAAAATLLLASVVESIILGNVVSAFTSVPTLWAAALFSVGYTVYAVVRGLRTMQGAPCAFPAGRMD